MSTIGGSPLNLIYNSFPTSESQKRIAKNYNESDEPDSIFQSSVLVVESIKDKKVERTNEKRKGGKRRLHSDDLYNTNLSSIISNSEMVETTSGDNGTQYPIKLTAQDFAYLKNVGVYPNNRLMVARRYQSPVGDDFTSISSSPIATLISWQPEGDNFLDISFGEEWESAEVDFKKVFEDMAKDFRASADFGGAGGISPLPGFTEIFQRQILTKLGIIDSDKTNVIPAGDPNLIKEAKQRKIPKDGSFNGVTAKVSIKMVCEWEQKFIAGIDPSAVFMDIIGTVLSFGTSVSTSYGVSGQFKNFVDKFLKDPITGINDIIATIKESIDGVINSIKRTILDVARKPENKDVKNKAEEVKDLFGIINKAKTAITDVLESVVKKYRVRIMGIINGLTLAPSTPWHITIGNPLKPIFCSGDMYTTNIQLTLGPTLAFNDLPSTIRVEFTLTNARNWGLQEIFAKFNTGYLRTVTQKSIYNSNSMTDYSIDQKNENNNLNPIVPPKEVSELNRTVDFESPNSPTTNTDNNTSEDLNNDNRNAKSGEKGKSFIGNGNDNSIFNPDANSQNPILN
jgi:hypothetical protein